MFYLELNVNDLCSLQTKLLQDHLILLINKYHKKTFSTKQYTLKKYPLQSILL